MQGFGRGGYTGPPTGTQFQQFGQNQRQEYDDEDEDGEEYGMEQYYDEDSEDVEDLGPEYLKNVPPGALFQGGPKPGGMSAAGALGGVPNYGAPVNTTSGVPFYGQQNRMASSSGFGMGQPGMGQPGMGMNMGMGAGMAPSGGGGFTYGMASKGGNLFGAPSTNPLQSANTFGAPSQSANLFQFGSASQFGGIGGGLGGAGSLFGAASQSGIPINDPYANIAIDLTKVKKSEPPTKPHELKTEEEKKKEAQIKKTSSATVGGGKSNLKKDYEDEEDKKAKRNVTFGKSTTYEVTGDESESGEFNNENIKGKGSPRPEKKVIGEKDLSDGRNEKEKIKEMLEQKEKEQIEEMKMMQQWKSKQDDKLKMESKMGENMKKSLVKRDSDDSLEDSYSDSHRKSKESESYEQDDFEDVSASGSGQQAKLNYWPGKDTYKKSEDSISASQSQENKIDNDIYDPSLMEAYLKKQKEKEQQSKVVVVAKKKDTALESSEGYDDDFESISKSNNAMAQINHPANANQQQQKAAFEYKQQQTAQFKSVLETYVKKDTKFIQTDAVKYDFMEAGDQQTGTFKEWTLQQNLKDAENLIQELKAREAEQKQKIFDLEEQFKKKDVEFQTQRRDALNAAETSKRLQEQIKDSFHKNNLYKIETEELIKQIDLADAKTREKEDEVKLVHAEYDRKLKLQEERILFRRGKEDERGVYEMKRQHMIEKEEITRKFDEKAEELDYYMQKVATLESENKGLRVGKDSNKRVRELEEQIEILKSQVTSNYAVQQENINLKNIKNDLSKEDQVKLQRELQQLELMIKGYQEENEKAVLKQKTLEKDLKVTQEKLYNESKRVKDLQQKSLLEMDQVYVEKSNAEIDIQTVNIMGIQNAISQKELTELHSQVKNLQLEKSDIERDLTLKDGQFKSKVNRLRDEKAEAEKKLLETEFLFGEKERDIIKLKDGLMQEKQILNERISELEDKVSWFRSNQKLLTDEDEEKQVAFKELQNLREKVKKGEEESKRARDLEKKCRLLEETIKSKNPNNIAMLLQAAKEKPSDENNEEKHRLADKVRKLEVEMEDKDRDFEKRIRTLRQEQERMKQIYEKRQGQTPEAKKVKELEDELQKTKDYYNKRIREIEDKYKFNKPNPKEPVRASSAKPQQQENLKGKGGFSNEQAIVMKEQIDQLTKERNLLAQKVVNLQTETNKRRGSFSGTQTIGISLDDPKSQLFNTIYSLTNIMKSSKGDNDSQKIFSLIQSCVSCVESIKSVDAVNSNVLAQLFKNITQEFHQDGTLNDKLMSEVVDLCRKEITEQKHSPLRHMNSANMNKDISTVMFEDDLKSQKSPIRSKPPKAVHPFVMTSSVQKQTPVKPRTIRDILKGIVNSGIDFESLLEDKGIKSKRIGINQLYQLLREENALRNITVDEVKQIQKFVKDKSGSASEEIGKGKVDEIDIHDFVNVMMDVSLDNFEKDEAPLITDSLFYQQPSRYLQDKPLLSSGKGQQEESSNGRVKELQEQLRKIKDDKEEEMYQNQSKIQRLQKNLSDVTRQKETLEERIEKLEASKQRMENILKQNLGLKNTLKKTMGSTGDSVDLLDEVGLMIKRLEYLEQQSEDRDKQAQMEHVPCKREMQRLSQALEEEKIDKARLLSKKNAEVAYFKSELDALLNEMQSAYGSKQRKPVNL